jgi:hypothetical protein
MCPLICLLTIRDHETEFTVMIDNVLNNEYLHKILISQIQTWWGKEIDLDIIKGLFNIYKKYMSTDIEKVQIIRTIKELFIKASQTNSRTLSKLIDEYFIPQQLEKKINSEVSTPYELRQDMLNKIPASFFETINKIFEPCCGKGGFIIDIVEKFMIGLKNKIKDKDQRYKTIVEKCLYFCDINPTNIFICKLLLDSNNEYNLNYYEGSTLELDITKDTEMWKGVKEFDAVIGNPPYNDGKNKGANHSIWEKFVEKALKTWIKPTGLLVYVTPSLWRNDSTWNEKSNPIGKLMKSKQIKYLEIHDESDGQKVFKCSTRYDWYLIKNIDCTEETEIKDQKGHIIMKNLSSMAFIPNFNFELIENLTNKDEKIDMLYSRSDYGSEKNSIWLPPKLKTKKRGRDWSVKQPSEYKYPVLYSVKKNNTPCIIYSNIKNVMARGKEKTIKEHYDTKKVMWGSGATGFIVDKEGKYACSEFCTAIIDDENNLDNIKKALSSNKFDTEVIAAVSVSKSELNRKILKNFNKNFWEQFV